LERILPAALAVRLPPGISEQVVATVLLRGLTAEMLVREVHRIEPGDVVLVHAAAGGVGRLVNQRPDATAGIYRGRRLPALRYTRGARSAAIRAIDGSEI
jgi:hypothetical protein